MNKIGYKIDVMWRRGDSKFVSIIVDDMRIENIPVPDGVRYAVASIKRWLDSDAGQSLLIKKL